MTSVGTRGQPAIDRDEREVRGRVKDLTQQARSVLAIDLPDLADDAPLEDGAAALLDQIADLVRWQLRAGPAGGARLSALSALGLDCADLRAAVREHRVDRRRRALAGISSAVSRMHRMTTTDELVQAVCVEVVRSCGFSRAMLSRVTEGELVPWTAHCAHREIRDSDREWMETTRIPLDSMILERELLDEAAPAFVADTATDPRPLPSFVLALGTCSYAAAPIAPARRVVGLLHADHFPSRRPVDPIDCAVLGEFADAFGRAYERVSLLERLRGHRDEVRETLRAAESMLDSLARAELELARRADQRLNPGTAAVLALEGADEIDKLLTARERQVVALVVAGHSNRAIAEQLVVSQGTVKSHVKQILRKLGAANRSEVITRYMAGSTSDRD